MAWRFGFLVAAALAGCSTFVASSPPADAGSADAAAPEGGGLSSDGGGLSSDGGGLSNDGGVTVTVDDVQSEAIATVDLTADGTLDWIAWGPPTNGCESCPPHFARAGLTGTSTLTGYRDSRALLWQNGTPTVSSPGDDGGSGSQVSGQSSLRFEVSVDPGPSKLVVHFGNRDSFVRASVSVSGLVVKTPDAPFGSDNNLLTTVHFASSASAPTTATVSLSAVSGLDGGVPFFVRALAATLARE